METKNNVAVIGLLTLILGLGIGYFAGTTTAENETPPMNHQISNGSIMGGGGMQDAMDGMMMGLEGKSGDELDKAFLDGMVMHHEGAIAMARSLLAETKRPELIELANDIIAAQTQEIEMMETWRNEWFNN